MSSVCLAWLASSFAREPLTDVVCCPQCLMRPGPCSVIIQTINCGPTKQKIVIFRDARQTHVSKGPGAIPGGLALSAGRFSNGEISEKQNVSPF